MSNDVCVIVGAKRSPFGKFGGSLRELTLPQLGSHAICAALASAGLAPSDVDELALGVNLPGSDRSVARQAMLLAGMPDDRSAYTVDRACCSSLTAITLAMRSIRVGEAKVALAGGAENMSRVPYFLEDLRWGGVRGGHVELKDQLVLSCPHTKTPRAVQAGREALRYGVDREQQDQWALRSQTRCARAVAERKFQDEIAPIEFHGSAGPVRLESDESPRPSTTLAQLAALPLANGSVTVTAGNAPGLNTGSSAVVIMSQAEARRRGLKPLCVILGSAMAAGHPDNICSIPAQAARRVLELTRTQLEDVDLVEINEAFAAVPLVTTLELARGNMRAAESLRDRTNVNGGAIAIGHATSATGARMVMTIAYELRRRGGGTGLATLCGGVGESEAVLLRVDS
jgi:acetyl-CoA C-acetyltransferase